MQRRPLFSNPPSHWLAIGVIAAGLLLFAVLSDSAARTKSATYDETLHSVGGFVHRMLGDFRINPEDPALFGYYGSLIHDRGDLKLVKDYSSWDSMLGDFATHQWVFSIQTLYQTPGNDGEAFVQRSRMMFTLVGVALGAVIAAWAWQLAGPTAALIACGFFCLDPNFAAHSSLFKNDVMLSLMLAGLSFALWRFGRRGTIASLAMIALTTAAAINIKFSGILCGPIIFAVLMIRALAPFSWRVMRWDFSHAWQRCVVVIGVCGVVAISCYMTTWAVYRFRYLPSDDPKVTLNTQAVVDRARMSEARAALGDSMDRTVDEVRAVALRTPIPRIVRTLTWAMDRRLLPQSWLFGFLFTYATTQIRSSFLLGEIRLTGWWYYFPCTLLFKTPTATLISLVSLPFISWPRKRSLPVRGERVSPSSSLDSTKIQGPFPRAQSERAWSFVCLAVPSLIYIGSAMSTNLNLGLRHILPIYPFLFITLGCGLAALICRSGRTGLVFTSVLLLGLAVESLAAYPDYLAFFNFPSGGSAGGIRKLGDSNLDWGQDLKGLATWRKQHPNLPMYLSYFGTASPRAYGIDAINVPYAMGGWPFDPNPQPPQQPCYFAISATNLQGIYLGDSRIYAPLRDSEPIAVIGGSIYIYQLPLTTLRQN